MAWADDKGNLGSTLMEGKPTFNAGGGLVRLDDTRGKKFVEKGVPTDVGSHDAITWGRWTGGNAKQADDDDDDDDKGKLTTLHYFAAASKPTTATVGRFTSFASTAPTVQSNGRLVATGSVNSATGTVNAALQLNLQGSATYSLSVPVSGQTFTLTGTATQTTLTTFSGVSLITSTGTGCLGGCTGSLGSNVSVKGQVAGTNGSSIGVIYGFDSRLGNVSGVIVFKN